MHLRPVQVVCYPLRVGDASADSSILQFKQKIFEPLILQHPKATMRRIHYSMKFLRHHQSKDS